MSWSWEAAWDSINDAFVRIADDIRECNPTLWWRCGHHENEVIPLSAWASFNRGDGTDEEDLVLSLIFQRADGRLYFTSDIGRNDGPILVDGPTASTPLAVDVPTLREWIAERVTEALAFMEGHLDLLKSELC